MSIEVQDLPGASELVTWFGYFPSFHDAEVVSLHLNRTGESILRVHTWETTRELDEKGFFVQRRHVVVEFALENITALYLNDFSQQNVISGLTLNKTETGFRLEFGPCYGLAGTIEAEKISLRLVQGKPTQT